MYVGSSIRLAAMAAMTLAGLAWAGGAQATIVDLGAAASPINVSGIPGIASITFSPSPAADVVYTPDGTDFPNQGATHIAGFVQTFLGLSTTPTFEEQFGSVAAAGQTFSFPASNIVALHQGSGEIVFEFASNITSFTVQGWSGANGTGSGVTMSSINFLEGTTTSSPVPEPSTWAMMLLGFAGLAFAGLRSRKTSVSIV